MPEQAVIARAGVHMWEEPVISGTRGSGTIFFSGCNLHCTYCQNAEISLTGRGKQVTAARLGEIIGELESQGVHNINFVTPSHYTRIIAQVLQTAPSVPVVYNSGGYDSACALKALRGKINIYMPDMKYALSTPARLYSRAGDYFKVACAAIDEMYAQTGDYVINDDGIMRSGLLVRHLILPGNIDNTKRVIDWFAARFKPGQALFSLMSQYTPMPGTAQPLNRKITAAEYRSAAEYLFNSGIEDGFIQELSSAGEEYIPDFDLSGV